jgi:hypothetical protein
MNKTILKEKALEVFYDIYDGICTTFGYTYCCVLYFFSVGVYALVLLIGELLIGTIIWLLVGMPTDYLPQAQITGNQLGFVFFGANVVMILLLDLTRSTRNLSRRIIHGLKEASDYRRNRKARLNKLSREAQINRLMRSGHAN